MPPVVELSFITKALADWLRTEAVAQGIASLGAPPRLYADDEVPDQPVEPYGVITRIDVGFQWDPGLSSAASGFVGAQVTGVGRLEQSASHVLDVVRFLLLGNGPATVTGSGDTHVKSVQSQGPPFGPIEAGTLQNMVETYLLYLEAS